MPIDIGLKNIKKYYAAEEVIHDITFSINTGEKVGLVGENGCGKTTLFKVIAGIEHYDGGNLSLRKGASVGLLDQIPTYPENYTGLDVLNTAFARQLELKDMIRALEKQMSTASGAQLDQILGDYSRLQGEFEALGGYNIEEQVTRICSGLRLDNSIVQGRFNRLSGGEKSITCVAKMLLEKPDILLLDEPSNHLDIEAVEWLENYIAAYPGTVMIISHDRYFLDRTVKKIIEIDNGEADIYHGNYSYYVQERERRLLAQFDAFTDQQKKIKAMEQAIKRFKEWGIQGDNPKFHKKAASLQKQLDKIERVDKPQLERDKIRLGLTASQRSGDDVIQVQDLSKSFSHQVVLKGVNLHLRHGERVAIIGNNGSGKTTLFKLILGKVPPDYGTVKLGARTQVGYLEQEVEFPNPQATILETFRDKCPMPEGPARSILAKYLFFGEAVFKPVETLSGGERSRLRLCQLTHQEINVLILDEPTNHLDIPAREMLEQALQEFDGTILFVSHDRYFVNCLAERVIEIKNGRATNFLGNYDYYRQKVQENRETIHSHPKTKEAPTSPQLPHRPKKVNTFKLEKLEAQIEALEQQLTRINEQMEHYVSDYQRLEELQAEAMDLQQKLDLAWEELASQELENY